MKIIRTLCLSLVAICCISCNNKDDVESIFTEKKWNLSFIASEGSYKQYNFWGGEMNGSNVKFTNSMNALKNTGNFFVEFTGSIDNLTISGTFSGKGISGVINGKWSANAETREMSTSGTTVSNSESDALAAAFIYGLQNAIRYEGDENNLFIYYKDKDASVKFMGLVVKKQD